MAREFTSYVIVQGKRFKPGDTVPDNLADLIGDHVTQGISKRSGTSNASTNVGDDSTSEKAPATSAEAGADDSTPNEESYLDWSKEELRTEADGRGLEVKASATKAELAEALEADDAENAEDGE
jgi:hypothetical protein